MIMIMDDDDITHAKVNENLKRAIYNCQNCHRANSITDCFARY